MILLFLFILFRVSVDAKFSNSPRSHLPDALRLKCDALPYRTAFTGTRCYFAVNKEVAYNEASAQCSSIFSGAMVAKNAPSSIFDAMMLDSSKYHSRKVSGAKQTICTYDSGYECEVDRKQSALMPGKCVYFGDKKMNYLDADAFCKRLGMELPSIGDELENTAIRGAITKDPIWIKGEMNFHNSKVWKRKDFGRFSTCVNETKKEVRTSEGLPRIASKLASLCGWAMSQVIDSSGYWKTDNCWESNDFVCVKNAGNDFTRVKKPCIANHEWDYETGRCKWNGPTLACAEIIDFDKKSWFMPMPNFPNKTYREMDCYATEFPPNDKAVKVIVRKGCMFIGWMNPRSGMSAEDPSAGPHRLHGEYTLPIIGNPGNGISRAECFCDPTDATLNEYIPMPPKGKTCIEHHVFDEVSQACEWKSHPKYCGELITDDGRRQMLEIPNWPTNRKYDVNHWNQKRNENFHKTVTEMIVRQHCWATLIAGGGINDKQTLKASGYGKHQVDEGTQRVICECIR